MLNPGTANALDPSARGFAQAYGQQGNAGFPLGLASLQAGGIQGGLQNVRGGLNALQANAAQQQAAQGRFAQQTALQNNLQQQLGQFQARQNALGNAGLANGVLGGNAAVAAGVRAQGLGGALGLNNPQLTAIRPGVDRNNIGLNNLGAGGVTQQNLGGLPGYQQANALAAALNNPQGLGINRLAAAGVNNQLLQNRLQNMGGNMGVNMMQQGMANTNTQGQDLLSLLAGKRPQVGQGIGNANNQQEAAYAALLKQQQQQQQGRGGQGPGGDFALGNPEEFPALSAAAQRNGDDGRGGYGGLNAMAGMGRGNLFMGGGDQYNAGNLMDVARVQAAAANLDYESVLRYQQQQQQQQQAGAGGAGPGRPGQAGVNQLSKGSMLGGLQGALLGAGDLTGKPGAPGGASQPPPDKWGLLAIMPLLKMTDQEATTLELGINLTTLGLDLTSPATLHKSLVTPLSNHPIRNEPEFELPPCYKHIPQRLQPGYLQKFKEETLFYIFYSMPADEAQLIAADELATRGWLFHKRLRMWMLPAPNSPAPQKQARGERGTFLVFNPTVWEVEQKQDLEVLYDDFESAPRLSRPPARQPPGAQQQAPNSGGATQQGAVAGGAQGAPGAAGMPGGPGMVSAPAGQPAPVRS